MKRVLLAVGLALVAAVGAAAPASASAPAKPVPDASAPVSPAPPGRSAVAATTTFVAGAFQFGTSDGAFGTVTRRTPFVGAGAFHSATYLAVQSADGLQTIEVGYHVRPGLYGNSRTHLFIAHWINGVFQCFNSACGFVQRSTVLRPGMEQVAGLESQFMIQHFQGNWWIGDAFEWIGFLPDSRWNGAFTRAGLVQWLGEVQTDGSGPCAHMGNSLPADSVSADSFFGLGHFNGPSPSIRVNETNHALYGGRIAAVNAVAYGGRGVC